MKCQACGYDKRTDTIEVDEIIYYTGKRKGEIKSVSKKIIEPDKDKPNFIKIEFSNSITAGMYKNIPYYGDMETEYLFGAQLYACPICKTLRIE